MPKRLLHAWAENDFLGMRIGLAGIKVPLLVWQAHFGHAEHALGLELHFGHENCSLWDGKCIYGNEITLLSIINCTMGMDITYMDLCLSVKLTTWGIWSNWGPCSVSCGWGMETRTRICLTGCRPSDKNNRVTRPCRRPSCAEWGGWGLWSECAGGLKTQTRLRSCYGYGKCNGWTIPKMSREERKCCAGKNCR